MKSYLLSFLAVCLLLPGTSWSADKRAKKAIAELAITIEGQSAGKIQIELNTKKAPKSAANFIKYVKSGHYDGTVFHRVIDNFMVQGGGFDKDFQKKSTRAPIQNEADNGLKNDLGTVAMARTNDPHSASAQFFINVKDNGFLNHTSKSGSGWGYCVFGKVIKGMKLVNKIKSLSTGGKGPFPKDVPLKTVMIKKAKML